MECVPSLGESILALLGESPNLTNQEIRKRLHQNKSYSGITKHLINTTLHKFCDDGVLEYRVSGINKCWYLSSVEEEEEDDEEYEAIVLKVKERAAIWKLRNPTNVYPTRPDRIANFIKNSAIHNLSPELLALVSRDISLNGWD